MAQASSKFSKIVSEVYSTPDCRRRREKQWHSIIIHHTGNYAEDESTWARISKGVTNWLTTKDTHFVSAHFQINRNGEVIQLCDPRDLEAFHAGKSEHWCALQRKVVSDWNRWAIGIELVGDGNKGPYSPEQYKALIELTLDLLESFTNISPLNILGHETISPSRKNDPGVYFDWVNYMRILYRTMI